MRKLALFVLLLCFAPLSDAIAAEYFVKHKGDHRRAEPEEGKALVYVFRPASVGAAIKTWAFADDELIGLSRAKGYYFAQVEPGKRLVWGKAENTSALEVELAAGETYYFKSAIKMGLGKARVKMAQMTAQEAEKYFEKCSFTEPTDEGLERATEIAANRHERAEANAEKKKAKGK